MRKRNIGLMAAAFAMAGLAGIGSASTANVRATAATDGVTVPIKSTPAKQRARKHSIVNEIGGLPLVSTGGAFGLTPKEYGMRYGNGGSKRSNRLRYSHNAKLKNRIARS